MKQNRLPLPAAYWRQWVASAISNLGDGVTFVALPLLTLALTDDTRLLALPTAATFVPWLVLTLPVGRLVDRRDRRQLMIAANSLRCVLLAIMAVGAVRGWLSIWTLIALLLVIGTCEVVFDSSAQAWLPMIVEPEHLGRANGLLFAAEVIAGSIVGLALGAVLFDVWIGLPFTFDAVTFAVAAALVMTVRPVRPSAPPAVDDETSSSGAASLRWLLGQPTLRWLLVLFTATNFGLMITQGIFVKFAVDELGLDESEYGIVVTIVAMGAATGGLIGDRVMSAFGLRPSVLVPYLVFGLGNLVIAAADRAWIVAAAGFAIGAGIAVWNVVTTTVRQRLIPNARFGRINSVYRLAGASAAALGVAAGGFIAHAWSTRTPFLVAGLATLGAGLVFARPILRGLGDQAAVPYEAMG